MPTIAQYGEQQVQITTTKGPQASELPVGMFPASQLSASLGDVANAAKQIGARVSQTQAEEALVKFERAKNDMMFNPESGYLNKQGKAAYDQAKPTSEALDKLMRDHADSISDPEARNAFTRVASQHVTNAQQSVMQHASKGLNTWEIDTQNAQIENVIENAALYRNDPKNLAVQRQLGLQTLLDSMDKQGITGDIRNEKMQNFDSAFAGATIKAAISDGASKGRAAFEKYGSMLEPDVFQDMKIKVENANVKDESLRLSLSLKGNEAQQRKTLTEMFKSGSITVEVHDATVSRVNSNFSQAEQNKDKNSKAMMGAIQDWGLKHPGTSVTDLPSQMYDWAKSEGHLASLDSFFQRGGKAANQQEELTTRGKLLSMSVQDPEAFLAKFNKDGFGTELQLGSEGIKTMQNIATDMIRGTGNYAKGFDQKILQDAIPKVLLASSKKDQRDTFIALQHEEMDKWRKANPGKFPTISEQQQVARSANASWVSLGWWNTQGPAYKMKDDIKAVPVDFYDQAHAYAKSKDKKVSDDEILAAWKRKVTK